jgi:multimeric flavodoxin WrbA
MKLLIISDKDNKTPQTINFENSLNDLIISKNIDFKKYEIGENAIKPCLGCFNCWIKTPGECIQKDIINEINRIYINSDVCIYITPISFGQISSNIKFVIDRRIPNILPFFEKENGETYHPLRYSKLTTNITIAYGDNITKNEKSTLNTIIGHQSKINNMIFYAETNENVDEIMNYLNDYFD